MDKGIIIKLLADRLRDGIITTEQVPVDLRDAVVKEINNG